MMNWRNLGLGATLAAGAALLSSCAQAPAPPPTVSAPRYVPRPYPPMGAPPNLAIPSMGVDGTRLTINRDVSARQAAWNLRSAYNVAALNCMNPEHAQILVNYGDFLKSNKSVLSDINRSLDSQFKAAHGSNYVAERENFQTQVYNYFALPATMPKFCDAALIVSRQLQTVPSGQYEVQAPALLAQLDGVFLQFFDDYDAYRRNFAQWQLDFERTYGVPPSDGYFLPGEQRYRPRASPMIPAAADPQAGSVTSSATSNSMPGPSISLGSGGPG